MRMCLTSNPGGAGGKEGGGMKADINPLAKYFVLNTNAYGVRCLITAPTKRRMNQYICQCAAGLGMLTNVPIEAVSDTDFEEVWNA